MFCQQVQGAVQGAFRAGEAMVRGFFGAGPHAMCLVAQNSFMSAVCCESQKVPGESVRGAGCLVQPSTASSLLA